MITPSHPANEKARLNILRSTGILDSAQEERFDQLTRIARRLFNVPIALVSLVDENRQWFKSCIGLDVRETPRDISFCGHAILGHAPFVINDATLDDRFADNPLVTDEPFIRFYAGCPLSHHDGNKLGTLCIIDRVPRNLDKDGLESLLDLAEMAERELAATHMATVDELTNISNRRGFICLAKNCLANNKRRHADSAIVFIDLNGFKAINDTYGHTEGDRALTAFANIMKESFRESDVMARLGGDEFVILLSGSNCDQIHLGIDRFRQRLKNFSDNAARGYSLRFSEGIVTASSGEDVDIESLLEKADTLMYQQKAVQSSNYRCRKTM